MYEVPMTGESTKCFLAFMFMKNLRDEAKIPFNWEYSRFLKWWFEKE